MALDIIDILLARAGASGGGSGGGDVSDAVTNVTVEDANTSTAKVKQLKVRKNNINRAYDIMKNYMAKGNNEDGSMTQKAITAELSSITSEVHTARQDIAAISTKADSALTGLNVLDQRMYGIDTSINNLNTAVASAQTTANNVDARLTATDTRLSGAIDDLSDRIDSIGPGGEINLGPENAGKIVVINSNGNIVAGSITEQEIIDGGGITPPPPPEPAKVLGLEIDYENLICTRLEDAAELRAGVDFDEFPMYDGRKRCNVADNGVINAFYGEDSYKDDGSNGQVMVYQPKFYYKRVITDREQNKINREELYICEEAQDGFKLHPLFLDESGAELDYILLPAYEGCTYSANSGYNMNDAAGVNVNTDKLSSIAGAKPLSGENNTIGAFDLEQLALNRGSGWHTTNMRMESALQMLMMVEYGAMNIQVAMNDNGPTELTEPENNTANCSLLTGSTASLGNATGRASSSIQTINGTRYTMTAKGKCAISYRGMENPWGNMWRVVGGIAINGGAYPYICPDYNYIFQNIETDYECIGYALPMPEKKGGYIDFMGYSSADSDWVYLPGTIDGANILVGDYFWKSVENSNCMVLVGGRWQQMFNGTSLAGPFCYDMSHTHSTTLNYCHNARIMYVPSVNSAVYSANKTKWMGV